MATPKPKKVASYAVHRPARLERGNVIGSGLAQAPTRRLRCPRLVWGDYTVRCMQERVVRRWRLYSQHVESGPSNDAFMERVGKVIFLYQATPTYVQEERRRLHQ